MLIKYKDFNANLDLTSSVTTNDYEDLGTYYIIFIHANAAGDDDNYNYWVFKNKEERDKVFKLIMSNFTDLERC